MKKYILYEIQRRVWSSNVVVGVYLSEDGKERREVIICPCGMNKKQGDEMAEKIKEMLEK